MSQISLQNVLPSVFADCENIQSEIWESNAVFQQGLSYLIQAESGRGKSTFCSYIYGLRSDYSGSISLDNKNIKLFQTSDWDNFRCSGISYLFQDLALFGELSSLENIQLKNRLTNHRTVSQIEDMFLRLEIDAKIHTPISKMSLGQQQRVALIRCLCQPFDFILLDEPISHLDDRNARLVADLINEIAKEEDAAIIVTSIGKDLPLNYDHKLAL